MKAVILLLIGLALAWYGFKHYNEEGRVSEIPSAYTQSIEYSKCTTADGHAVYGEPLPGVECIKNENIKSEVIVVSGQKKPSEGSGKNSKLGNKSPPFKYRCDGRVHCSQMASCEEAEFFLANCPSVEMDGDNDGVPCERQWCL